MFRRVLLLGSIAALALSGCGNKLGPQAAIAVNGAASAKSVVHFSTPKGHLLAQADQNTTFDQALALAVREDVSWDKKTSLFLAYHYPAHPKQDGSIAPPRTLIGVTAGIDELMTAVAPQTVAFKQSSHLLAGLFVGAIDPTKLISESAALATARGTGKIKSDDPVVTLARFHFFKDAVYSFRDAASAVPAADAATAGKVETVEVDAYTGQLVGGGDSPTKKQELAQDATSLIAQTLNFD